MLCKGVLWEYIGKGKTSLTHGQLPREEAILRYKQDLSRKPTEEHKGIWRDGGHKVPTLGRKTV